jgi:transposase
VRPEEVRREVKRLEDERLRLAPEVTGGDPAAVAEDQRLEKRIRELASTERETEREVRSDELGEARRRNRPGNKGGGRGRSG